MLRHQLPVLSPVRLRDLLAGAGAPGSAVGRLESRIRGEYGPAAVLLTASGTVALALACREASGSRRPRVALPGWACPDLMTAADAVDAEVLLYDLDPVSLAPDRDSLRRVLGEGPTAVVVAHWFGLPVDLAGIREDVEAAGAVLIDDAAQGVGASMEGRPAGSGGAFGVLSFGRGKGRTGGGGGALLGFGAGAVEAIARASARLEAGGAGWGALAKLAVQWAIGRPWAYGLPVAIPGLGLGQTRYHLPPALQSIGRCEAAVVGSVWEASGTEVVVRRRNAERWRAGLAPVKGLQTFGVIAGGEAGWLRFPVRADPRIRELLESAVMRKAGVMPGYPSVLQDLPLTPGRLAGNPLISGCRELVRTLLTLPTHRLVSDSDFSHVFSSVQGL